MGPVDQVVDVAHRWGLGAVGELAVLVSQDDGGAQVRRDGAGGAADVQWLAGGAERCVEQRAAQVGGQPAGAGERGPGSVQEGGLQPGRVASRQPEIAQRGRRGGGPAGRRAWPVPGLAPAGSGAWPGRAAGWFASLWGLAAGLAVPRPGRGRGCRRVAWRPVLGPGRPAGVAAAARRAWSARPAVWLLGPCRVVSGAGPRGGLRCRRRPSGLPSGGGRGCGG